MQKRSPAHFLNRSDSCSFCSRGRGRESWPRLAQVCVYSSCMCSFGTQSLPWIGSPDSRGKAGWRMLPMERGLDQLGKKGLWYPL